jgi:translation elongation factor EF-G
MTAIPLQIPIGAEENFRGIVDLITNKAFSGKNNHSGWFC